MSSEEVVALPVSDCGLTWGWSPFHESSRGVSMRPRLQSVSGGGSESFEEFMELRPCSGPVTWGGMAWPVASLLPFISLCPEVHVCMSGVTDWVFTSVLLNLLTRSLLFSIDWTLVEVADIPSGTASCWSSTAGPTSECCSREEETLELFRQDVTSSLLLVLPLVESGFNCWVTFLKSECLGLDTESFTAVLGFLEPAGVLTTPEDFRDDFVGSVSGAFCLGPVLFGAEGDCLEEDVEALTLGLDSGMAFVVFFVVAGLDISFSTSFLGEAGFLELRTEPGLDEAERGNSLELIIVYNKLRLDPFWSLSVSYQGSLTKCFCSLHLSGMQELQVPHDWLR